MIADGEVPEGVRVHLKLDTGMGRWGLSELPVPGREVVGLHVDLAALQRGEHDLAVPEVELAGDRVSVGLEDLAIQLPEDELLAQVRGTENVIIFASARKRDPCVPLIM